MLLDNVTATISTKGRFHTTLPLVLTSLVTQTVGPKYLIIYDDNDNSEDLRHNEIYKNLFMLMDRKSINWQVVTGSKKGQIHNHQRALTDATTEYIWRLDDDNIMEPDTLQWLYHNLSHNTEMGAIGPLILDPKRTFGHPLASNKMRDIFLGLNIQWCDTELRRLIEVEHLQGSTFLFRKEAGRHGYDLNLSKVGHREETIFTYEMVRKGWKLFVDTGVKTWHLHYGSGGIRSESAQAMFHQDEAIFNHYLNNVWKIAAVPVLAIPLDNGIGDHYAFRMALPAIKARFKDYRIIIGACYPEVFLDEEGVEIVSLDATRAFVNPEDRSIYKWIDSTNWKGSLSDAFKAYYLG